MIQENKTSKYLLYAIGEIILVVIGILIALQINNNNEKRKVEKVEVAYLKRLLVDLQKDEALWQATYDRKENQIYAANRFIEFSFSKQKDTVLQLMPRFKDVANWQDINTNQITFQEMVSSGNLDLIQNDSIKIKLLELDSNYQSILNWDETVEKEQARLIIITSELLNARNFIPLDPQENKGLNISISQKEMSNYLQRSIQDMNSLLEDNTFINVVLGVRMNHRNQLPYFIILKKGVQKLISLIETELKERERD